MSSSICTTLKRFGINLHFCQSLYYILRPPGLGDHPIKMYAVLSRVPVREHLISSICWGRSFVQRSLTEPCYNSLSRSRSFRNCHVALLLVLHVCYRVYGIFCLLWLVFFFNVIFPLSLCSLSSTHACMHVFFLRKISHPSIQPSIHSLFHLSTFLSNLPAGHEKNETVAVVCRE